MRYSLKRTVAPASAVITPAQLRDWMRVSSNAEDTLQTLAIAWATDLIERTTGIVCLQSTYRMGLDSWPADGRIRLPRTPLSSVSSVQYYDQDGTLQTLSGTLYDVDDLGDPPAIVRAYGATWPVLDVVPNAVRITWVAGHATAADVPPAVVQAVYLTATQWLMNRGDTEGQAVDMPEAAARLLKSVWNGDYAAG